MIVQKQVAEGLLDEEDLTENFKTEAPVSWMVRQKLFWFELFIMMAVPLPFLELNAHSREIKMTTVNWIDGYNTP